MRIFRWLFVCALALGTFVPGRANAAPPRSLDIRATHVFYYSNRFILTADGNVRVRFPDGTLVRGETFTMDLKLNRYLIAGGVTIDRGKLDVRGAALAGYPDYDRHYFIPSTPVPDRWTFVGGNWAKPIKGGIQPGDAFYFPDLSAEKPFIKSNQAKVLPKTLVDFTGASIYAFGAYLPIEKYAIVFSGNPNYEQNGFAAADFDFSVPFLASEHSVTAVHARYDSVRHLYFSYDQHFVWGPDYVVLSENPATNIQKQWNFIGYDRLSPNVDAKLFQQVSTLGHGWGLTEPAESGGLTNFISNVYSPHLQLAFNFNYLQTNASFLDGRIYLQEQIHPSQATLSASSLDHAILKIKHQPVVTIRYRGGYGFQHEAYQCGLGAACNANPKVEATTGLYDALILNTPITTLTYNFLGITAYTSSIPLIKDQQLFFNAVFDKQRQSYSMPFHVDTTTTNLSISKLFGRRFALVGTYSIAASGDYFGSQQLIQFPPGALVASPYTNVTYGDFVTYRGLMSAQTLAGSAVITPNPYFNLNLRLSSTQQFPENVPGVYGAPPIQLSADLRVRLARQIQVDISRAYYFNYYTQTYSPAFGIVFSQ
jgi:hypothetical protein